MRVPLPFAVCCCREGLLKSAIPSWNQNDRRRIFSLLTFNLPLFWEMHGVKGWQTWVSITITTELFQLWSCLLVLLHFMSSGPSTLTAYRNPGRWRHHTHWKYRCICCSLVFRCYFNVYICFTIVRAIICGNKEIWPLNLSLEISTFK